MEINDITYKIIGCAYKVHLALGPGLLESTYEVCLVHELVKLELKVEQQKALPVVYDGIKLDAGYRIDLLVEDKVIVELKAVDAIAEIHKTQVLTYLKLSRREIGLLMNFNVTDMKKGVTRLVMSNSNQHAF
jgi:GxxExxY protein